MTPGPAGHCSDSLVKVQAKAAKPSADQHGTGWGIDGGPGDELPHCVYYIMVKALCLFVCFLSRILENEAPQK